MNKIIKRIVTVLMTVILVTAGTSCTNEPDEETVLTLAVYMMIPGIQDAVTEFNLNNHDYRIEIIDYSQFNTEEDRSIWLTRLTTDITTGNIPDIMATFGLPYGEYAAKGLFADLYAFIDSDLDFDRADFVEGAFRAAEIDGCLYQVFPSFFVKSVVGHPSVVGPEPGWNIDEFRNVLDAHHEADIPFGQGMTKWYFLRDAISFDIDRYIDFASGTARFDTADFVQLLEFANRFHDEIDWDNYMPEEEAIATGRQIVLQTNFTELYDFQWSKAVFGGELVYKGFPSEHGSGNALSIHYGLAITEQSPNKDAAWSFVRTILDNGWQLANTWDIPTNQAAFDQRVADTYEMNYDDRDVSATLHIQPFTQADIDQIKDLVSSADSIFGYAIAEPIWDIISESALDYFAGKCSAPDAARVIQNRVAIIVSERN